MWQIMRLISNDLKPLETHLYNIANYLETVFEHYPSIIY